MHRRKTIPVRLRLAAAGVAGVAGLGGVWGAAAARAATITSANPITATMDGGTTLGGFTWYMKGYNAAAPATGLPSGTVVSQTDNGTGGKPTISYVMPGFSAGNDALLLMGTATGNVPSATLTFAAPVAMTSVSLLTSTGNGGQTPPTLSVTLNLVVGGSVAAGQVTAPDWFGGSPVAINANGRVQAGTTGMAFDSVNGNVPSLYDETLATGTGAALVSSISITETFTSGATSQNTAIFAVSRSTDGATYAPVPLTPGSFNQSIVATPEPAAAGLLALAGLPLLARRRPRSA